MEREGIEYVSVNDAAQYGIAASTLWVWLRADRLPSYKFSHDKHTYVKRSELEAILNEEPKPGPGRPGRWRRPTGGGNT